ncbi:MAG: hypothetical protein HQ523_07100 [Lentisphaerae bacterium]|nr:hypothetical protein [Lentisphaerota bacterium]
MCDMSGQSMLLRAILTTLLLCGAAGAQRLWDDDFDHEAYEEPAGATFAFLVGPSDDIYGISVGSGTWLADTPVFGDYFVSLFYNGLEEASYSSVGMTIRLLPHWRVAPFVGGGGSYNYSFNSVEDESADATFVVQGEEYSTLGESYWGGHVEAGVRVTFGSRRQLLEVMGRYTWSSNEGDLDYWLVGVSTGVGI